MASSSINIAPPSPGGWGSATSARRRLSLLTGLNDVVNDGTHAGIIEHQGGRQVHPDLLVEGVTESHTGQAVHTALHERGVQVELVVISHGALRRGLDNLLDPFRVQAAL